MIDINEINYRIAWVEQELRYLDRVERARIERKIFEIDIELIIMDLGLRR